MLVNEFVISEFMLVQLPKAPQLAGFSRHAEQYNPSLFPTVKFELSPGVTTFYFGVDHHGTPGLLSLTLSEEKHFETALAKKIPRLLVIVGLTLGMLVFNVILLFNTQARMLWTFGGMILSFAIFVLHAVGLPSLYHWGMGPFWASHWMETFTCSLLFFVWYLIDFFEVSKKDRPWVYYIAQAISGAYLLEAIFYRLFADLTLAILVPLGIGSGMLTIFILITVRKERIYNLLFAAAFLPMIITLVLEGLMIINVLSYGGYIIEMLGEAGCYVIVVTALITGRRIAKIDQKARKTQHAIALARSVQDLLLPGQSGEDFVDFCYRFHYQPNPDSMSGDWIQSFARANGDMCLMIGDISARGPQAAIAVSTIATVVDRSKHKNIPLDQVIRDINFSLTTMFAEKVKTTASAINITKEGLATLYAVGGPGWILLRSGSSRIFRPSPGWLGTPGEMELIACQWELQAGDVLMSITDGCYNQIESLQQLIKGLEQLNAHSSPSHNYLATALAAPHKSGDDRAMLLVMGTAA